MNNDLKQSYAAAFQAAYNQLNPAQKMAVDTIEGPVMVVAGPGTGKTHVLTMRIANILRLTDTKPSSILALTFTESAAQNMRLRLATLIGPDAYYVHISTFHAFCDQLITNHLEYFPLNPASKPITDLERFELLRSILEELPLETIKPLNAPLFHVRSLMTNISAFKREGVSPESLRRLVEQEWQNAEEITSRTERLKIVRRQAQLSEQISVYQAYQERLRAAGRYDFEDMLSLTVEVLSKEELLLQEYQEQYLYLLVDEYQDTNTVQNQVTHLLARYWEEEANFFVVGDPHQSIYRFQGASLENIVQFVQWYPQAEIITLTEGYRCPASIYELAHDLIAQDTSLADISSMGESGGLLLEALQTVLHTDKQTRESVIVRKASDQNTSLVVLAETIASLLESGTSPNEIAILYTKNRFAADIIPILEKWSIPYHLEGGSDALQQPIIGQFEVLCTIISTLQQGDDPGHLLFELCTYPWLAIDRTTLFQLGRIAGKTHRSLFEVLKAWPITLNDLEVETVEQAEVQKMMALLVQLESWGASDYQDVFTHWLEVVVSESGLHQYVVRHADTELEPLLAIYSLFSFIKQLNQTNQQFHLIDFVRAMSTLREQKVSLPLQTLSNADQRIRLSTVHKAKGQEWQYVFLLHVVDGIWGNKRAPASLPVPENILTTTSLLDQSSKEQQNQDDRRLFYVAMTRAKERLELLYPAQSDQDGLIRPRVPSMFLSEIGQRSEMTVSEATPSTTAAELAATLIGPRPRAQSDDRLLHYLKSIAEDFSLSITALNNYLHDPSKFFYQNLLALPSAKLPHLAYGTAIHAALEYAGRMNIKPTSPVAIRSIVDKFVRQLDTELLAGEDRERRKKRGTEVLLAYYALQPFSGLPIWKTEYSVGYGSQAAFLDDIFLTGRLDRLDWADATKKSLHVIDYKTGKPKTRNEILMLTETAKKTLSEREKNLPESIRGSYQRQLLFYRLLGKLDRSITPAISLGTFDFVEAALDSEKLIQHTFTLEDDAVKTLEELIRQVMTEIRSVTFVSEIPELTR